LCEILQVKVVDLEDALQHVQKSLRAAGGRLVAEPARCDRCGFEFRKRLDRRFSPPGRCPECRSREIISPNLRIETRV